MKTKMILVLLGALLLGGCAIVSNESTPLAQKADLMRRNGTLDKPSTGGGGH